LKIFDQDCPRAYSYILGRSGFDLQVLNKGANLVKFTGLSIRGEDMAEQVEPLLINLHEVILTLSGPSIWM